MIKTIWNKLWQGGAITVMFLCVALMIWVAYTTQPRTVTLQFTNMYVVTQADEEFTLITETTCPVVVHYYAAQVYATIENQLTPETHKISAALIQDLSRVDNKNCYIGDINNYPYKMSEFTQMR